MDTPDVEASVRVLLAASGLSLSPEQIDKYVRIYPTLRAAADRLYAIPELRYEQPAVVYHSQL